ncbi:MAG: cytochrome b [Enhydrobacter sp.]|nr:MAG: cytochrome b [Enhydrobacter sp.]
MPGAEPGHHPLAKLLHWLTALLVLGLLMVGLWMTGLPFGLPKLQAYAWHKWIGLLVLALTVARLFWRRRFPPPPLPDRIAPWEKRLAPLAHGSLLALLLAMPVTGWLMSSAGGVAVVWFGILPLPDLVPRDQQLFAALRTSHRILSRLLIALVALHVLAVLRHDVLRRDGIFRRMWP